MLDKYIKMILALDDEFFKEWKWKEGDQFVLEYNSPYNMKVHCIGDAVVYKSKVYDIEITSDDIRSHLEDARPLPSQEQLQEIILNYQENTTGNRFNNWKLIKEFYNFINSGFLKCVPETYTARELWLQYLMHVVCNHRWNGEAWI